MKIRVYQYKILLLFVIVFLSFAQTGIGSAQIETPTPEPDFTATDTESLLTALTGESFTETAIPFVTETNTPVVVEPSPVVENTEESSAAVVQILIQIQASAVVSESEVRETLKDQGNVIQLDELEKLGVVMLEVPLDQLEEKMRDVQAVAGVGNVELNDSVQALDTIPNDPNWGSQYALTAIRAPQGWDISTGSSAVTIAIVDSGVDLGHIDLAGKIVGGYDFVNNDNVPQDDYGHGTHVAGIAAASGNNGAGMAGVSWGARIMPVKVLGATGTGSFSTVALGIVWAVDHGAQIINLSLGTPSSSFTLQDAVEYAYDRGVLVIAASGNSGSTPVYCPACYPQVMAVGATDVNNQIASFSTYGNEVDIAAPGQSIFSLAPGGYAVKNGTSMAAPHVSGLAAILYSYSGSAATVWNAMQATAFDVGPAGWDQYSGAGLIQMDAAIRFVIPPTPLPVLPDSSSNGNGGTGNPNGILISLPSFTPLPTSSLLPALSPAATTPTLTPLIVSPTFTSTAVPVNSPPPALSGFLKRLVVFQSAPFCWGIFLLLLGLLLIWLMKRGQR